jgi:hypothetical protein
MLGSGGIFNFSFTSWKLYSMEKSPQPSVHSRVGKLNSRSDRIGEDLSSRAWRESQYNSSVVQPAA